MSVLVVTEMIPKGAKAEAIPAKVTAESVPAKVAAKGAVADLASVLGTDVRTEAGVPVTAEAAGPAPVGKLLVTKGRHLVLKRSDDKVGLTTSEVEAMIGLPMEAAIPTSRSIQISINQGAPLVQSDPRSPAGRSLADFARRLVQTPAAEGGRGRRFSRKDGR